MKTTFRDNKTGLIVNIGIVLSLVTEQLLPLRATPVTDNQHYYSVSVSEFLSERFIEAIEEVKA